jgi:hypothetical protein
VTASKIPQISLKGSNVFFVSLPYPSCFSNLATLIQPNSMFRHHSHGRRISRPLQATTSLTIKDTKKESMNPRRSRIAEKVKEKGDEEGLDEKRRKEGGM